MFEAVQNATKQALKYTAARAEVDTLVKAGRPFLSTLLGMKEPMPQIVLCAIDGIRREGNLLTPTGERMEMPPIRLACIEVTEPNATNRPSHMFGRLRYKKLIHFTVPGTDLVKEEWVWADGGTEGSFDHLTARQILNRDGWPIVNARSKGARSGNVVEVEWLRNEAARPDARHDVKDAWEKVRARIEPQIAQREGSPSNDRSKAK